MTEQTQGGYADDNVQQTTEAQTTSMNAADMTDEQIEQWAAENAGNEDVLEVTGPEDDEVEDDFIPEED